LSSNTRHTGDTTGGKEITVEELMKEVVTYRHFMNASGGGVTASGGEAILQAEFVRDWFRACKKEGIHTCLDTNGFVRRYDPVIDELLEVTDLVVLG
ncbi:radical SAM protein, partial [Klebsiella pneumoniae]|uniref:radical SAM protein n=1 Tax=Klebsiella pneumoniae TaxID=573 RepID=UPI00396940C7